MKMEVQRKKMEREMVHALKTKNEEVGEDVRGYE